MKIIKRESADYHTRVLSLSSVSLETGNKPLSHQPKRLTINSEMNVSTSVHLSDVFDGRLQFR